MPIEVNSRVQYRPEAIAMWNSHEGIKRIDSTPGTVIEPVGYTLPVSNVPLVMVKWDNGTTTVTDSTRLVEVTE